MKQSILVDIDDTLAATQNAMTKYVNSKSQRQFFYEEMNREFRESNTPEWSDLIDEYLTKPELVIAIAPYHDALEGIKLLHDAGCEIHIASARKEDLHQVTHKWLDTHGFIDYITKVHGRHGSVRSNDFKLSSAKLSNATVAFDDTYEVAEVLAENGLAVYLIAKPWNQEEPLHPNMKLVSSFREGVDDFLVSSQIVLDS
jgi:uncharacterized HAD superfamily protein